MNTITTPAPQVQTAEPVQDDSDLFRQLFEPSTEADIGTTQSVDGTAGPQAVPEEFFLKGTTSVYKTSEAAIDGINEKDRMIAELQEKVQTLGNPSGPSVGQPTAQIDSPGNVSYLQDPNAYVKSLTKAAESGDASAYRDVQVQLLEEVVGPYLPMLADVGKSRAHETVGTEFPEFNEFASGTDYAAILEGSPVLAEAIQAAEGNPQMAAHLPGLYRLAYLSSRGLNATELAKAAYQQGAASAPNVVPETSQRSGSLTPQTPITAAVRVTGELSPEERKAQIAQLEAGGISDLKF